MADFESIQISKQKKKKTNKNSSFHEHIPYHNKWLELKKNGEFKIYTHYVHGYQNRKRRSCSQVRTCSKAATGQRWRKRHFKKSAHSCREQPRHISLYKTLCNSVASSLDARTMKKEKKKMQICLGRLVSQPSQQALKASSKNWSWRSRNSSSHVYDENPFLKHFFFLHSYGLRPDSSHETSEACHVLVLGLDLTIPRLMKDINAMVLLTVPDLDSAAADLTSCATVAT